MKNVLTRILQFLKDHCFGILLLLFLPGWGVLLELLAALGIRLSPVAILVLPVVSLLVCAVAAVVRMYRDGVQRLSVYVLFTLDLLFILHFFPMLVAVQMKSDRALTYENMALVNERLIKYIMVHGSFPPQQDFESLLKTLNIQKSEFRKTFFFSIESAEYHALDGTAFNMLTGPLLPPQNWEERVLTLPVKEKPFGGFDTLMVLRRDGSIAPESLKNKNPASERKPEADPSIIIQEEAK